MKNKIVVDANIIFSAMLKRNNRFLEILYDDRNEYYSPNFIIVELFKNKEKIKNFTKLKDLELIEIFKSLIELINFIPLKEIDNKSLKIAKEITPDLLDVPFVALTLFLNAKLWTGDIKLCNSLKERGYNICIKTSELIE